MNGRRDLILGLHRRLGGWCHLDKDEEWRDTSTYLVPQSLSVWAKVVLAPDDVLRLFADHVPGLRQTEFDPDFVELESAALKIQVIRNAPEDIDPYPWIQAQPWHDPAEPVTEYALYTSDDAGPGERRSIEHALHALATATGGNHPRLRGFPLARRALTTSHRWSCATARRTARSATAKKRPGSPCAGIAGRPTTGWLSNSAVWQASTGAEDDEIKMLDDGKGDRTSVRVTFQSTAALVEEVIVESGKVAQRSRPDLVDQFSCRDGEDLRNLDMVDECDTAAGKHLEDVGQCQAH